MSEMPVYKKKDFVSDQEVRWCPGCGDYSILASVQMTLPKLGIPKEKFVFISGIGCASRFPYYMNTYGLHTIHGRAPAFASGVKLQNPDLSVWVITGDGDSLSIGGNHFIHLIRRNVDLNLIIFNNEIYGLTKGQYSPTSKEGLVTKSTPYGSIDRPFSPASLSLGAGASFFARTIDTDPKHMQETFMAAAQHKGTSIIEVLQNCVIFNDKAHDIYTNRETRAENTVNLKANEPLIYGKNKDKGLVWKGHQFETVEVTEENKNDIWVHNPNESSPVRSFAFAQMELPEHPLPLGVLRSIESKVYDYEFTQQLNDAVEKKGKGKMEDLLGSGDVWTV